MIPPLSNVCPICGKENPLGPLRCPACRSPIKRSWEKCNHCGLVLEINCPSCNEKTFFGDYCEHCDSRLIIQCKNPKCNRKQPPIKDVCIYCGKPLK
jgi:predicted amidophosphoribosyltransferase